MFAVFFCAALTRSTMYNCIGSSVGRIWVIASLDGQQPCQVYFEVMFLCADMLSFRGQQIF